jgi:HNH endonuclease/AP2 domain
MIYPVPPELLHKLVSGNPKTGKMTWLFRPAEFFPDAHAAKAWNARYAESPAFESLRTDGYLSGRLFRKSYKAHRVIWALHYGVWPAQQIDHINREKADNRISNLREATPSQNSRNVASKPGSSSRFLGVSLHKPTGTWSAKLSVAGKHTSLGYFNCEVAAARAYDAAAFADSGEFANLNFPEDPA